MDYITTREVKIGGGVRFLCSGLGKSGEIRIVFSDRSGVPLFSHVLDSGDLMMTILGMAMNDNSLQSFIEDKGGES